MTRDTDALRHLKAQGLLSEQSFTDRAGVRHVLSLTEDGKALLDSRRESTSGKAQTFYQGVVKPREVSHDSRLYRVFLEEAARLERDGSRVCRVALDYELKRDYQRYLNRPDRGADATPDDDRLTFAEANGLHVVNGHIVFPDLRIEYETSDGRTEYRDVELVTEHYSRSQLAAKAAAGFVQYRQRGWRWGDAPERAAPVPALRSIHGTSSGCCDVPGTSRCAAALGLTNRQTRFVVTVALHGGYCLRRQYMTFAGTPYGAPVREFLEGLVARGLARRLQFRRDRGYVYHLHNARLYRGP